MERSNSANSSTANNASTHPLQNIPPKPKKHNQRQVLHKATMLRKLFMPRKQFNHWLTHSISRQALAVRRVEVLNTLHPPEHVAYWLDHDLAFDHSKGLSLHACEQDPVSTEAKQIVALRTDPAATSYTLFEKIKQRLGWGSFKQQNQKDVTRYVNQIIQQASTPHALTHLHQQTWQMAQENHISKKQFHALSTNITKQFKSILPAVCKPLKNTHFPLLNRQEAIDVLKHCYSLTIALKTAAPSLLDTTLPFSTTPIKKALQETAIDAYRRTVAELQIYSDDEAEWYVKDSLSQMHDVLKPMLFVTCDRPWRSLKGLQKKVQFHLRQIYTETMTAHYRLYKQTKQASEHLSTHERLRNKHRDLEGHLKQLNNDMSLLKKSRKELRETYQAMEKMRHELTLPEKIAETNQDMDRINLTIKQVSRGIRNIHKKRTSLNAKLTNTTLSLTLSEEETERYKSPTRAQFLSLFEEGLLSDNDLIELHTCFNRVKQESCFDESAAEILLENYVKWVSLEYIQPYEALHYLQQSITDYVQEEQEGEHPDLNDLLFNTNDAILDYAFAKRKTFESE